MKAQVMERDDNRGGWVPIHGGGISVVGLHTMSSVEDLDTVQYRVDAKRVKDHAVSNNIQINIRVCFVILILVVSSALTRI